MQYIKEITPTEWNEAFKKSYGILTQEEFWDLRFANATKDCICYATIDGSCYYYYDTKIQNFVYFALERKIQNIKGLYEIMIDLVCKGIPYVHYNGKKGRYNIIEKAGFKYIFEDEAKGKDPIYEFKIVYAAHPENMELLKKKIERI